jgi:ABC-2 type transport system ATP-binding protein
MPLVGESRQASIAAPENGAVIEAWDLQRRFGDFYAVKGVSFNVQRGEIFGLLGANGAGKSTTFRMLCGLLPVSAGEVQVAGLNLRHAAARARGRLGYMAQRFSLYVNLTVLQNLRFFASAYGLDRARSRQRIAWALKAFDLAEYANTSSRNLPLGFKQRLAMAAALIHEPDILFLDEPTSGIDPLARREFWQRINTLAESGVTVLVTTHFMDEANYCDRLVIMAEGEVLAEGTPADMKARFRSEEHPDPTMEDAFISLIETHEKGKEVAV